MTGVGSGLDIPSSLTSRLAPDPSGCETGPIKKMITCRYTLGRRGRGRECECEYPTQKGWKRTALVIVSKCIDVINTHAWQTGSEFWVNQKYFWIVPEREHSNPIWLVIYEVFWERGCGGILLQGKKGFITIGQVSCIKRTRLEFNNI